MHITTEDNKLYVELKIQGDTFFAENHTPIDLELHDCCPRIILTSSHEWNPHDIKFNNCTRFSSKK